LQCGVRGACGEGSDMEVRVQGPNLYVWCYMAHVEPDL